MKTILLAAAGAVVLGFLLLESPRCAPGAGGFYLGGAKIAGCGPATKGGGR